MKPSLLDMEIGVKSTDLPSYSPDATMVAIARSAIWEDGIPLYQVVDVYDLTKSLQPGRLLYHTGHMGTSVVTSMEWVDNTLLVNLGSFPLRNKDLKKRPRSKPLSPQEVGGYIEVKKFPAGGLPKIDSNSIRLFLLQGGLFVDQYSKHFLVSDPLSRLQPYWDEEKLRFRNKLYYERSVDVYSFGSGKPTASATLALPRIKSVTAPDGTWHPLNISADGKSMMAWTEDCVPWNRESSYSGPYIIAVDLVNSKIRPLNSELEGQGLASPAEGNTLLYALGRPATIREGKTIIARLSLGSATRRLIFRFGLFDDNGQEPQDILIFDKDLQRAKMPDSQRTVVTWSPDGHKVITQGKGEVWQLDWGKAKASKLCSGMIISGVVGWIDDTRLLVRARKKLAPADEAARDAEVNWGILDVPSLSP